jgi:hypothetical protein
VAKLVNGVRVKGWLYADQLQPIAELDANNAVVSRFVYASKPNVPDYIIRNGETYRIVSDHLGSPRIVTHVTTGEIVQRLDCDAFGVVTQDSNPGFSRLGSPAGSTIRTRGWCASAPEIMTRPRDARDAGRRRIRSDSWAATLRSMLTQEVTRAISSTSMGWTAIE